MESHGLDFKSLSKLIGCHDNTIYNICHERRVPSKPTFEKIKEVTGKTDAELLLPLVGGM
jgi:plasmid maintenance system antidote protein VapI